MDPYLTYILQDTKAAKILEDVVSSFALYYIRCSFLTGCRDNEFSFLVHPAVTTYLTTLFTGENLTLNLPDINIPTCNISYLGKKYYVRTKGALFFGQGEIMIDSRKISAIWINNVIYPCNLSDVEFLWSQKSLSLVNKATISQKNGNFYLSCCLLKNWVIKNDFLQIIVKWNIKGKSEKSLTPFTPNIKGYKLSGDLFHDKDVYPLVITQKYVFIQKLEDEEIVSGKIPNEEFWKIIETEDQFKATLSALFPIEPKTKKFKI